MKKGMTKRILAFALAFVMLAAACVAYTASTSAEEAQGVFVLDITAAANAADRSVIDVVVTATNIKQALNGVEFKLNFDKSLVAGVVTTAGSDMDAFMTTVPMYTLVTSGMEIPMPCYEQICTYDAENGYYVCRFADLLDYPGAKTGEAYSGALINDGDLQITIQFKLLDGVAAGQEVAFSVTDVKGTTEDGLKSVGGIGDAAVYTVPAQETVTVPTVTAKSFSLSFEDEILVNFYYTVSDLSAVSEHGMLVFYTQPGTVSYADADEVYNEPVYDAAKTRYMATTQGIVAKEMGDTRYYVAYAKLSDGSYVYSGTYDYSPKKYAANMLSKSTTSDKQKALCVAMLNYGAAAQNYFTYNTDSLMNADLTAEQKALVIGYDAGLFTGAVAADSSKVGSFAATSTGFSKKSATVSFDGAFAINYYFTPNVAVSGEMTLYYWSPADYANVSTMTAANATGSVTMVAGEDGRYWAQVSGIAAKALDETYYVAGVYTDADGNQYCTGVVAYSLSKYCINNAKDGKDMQELAAATAMYGYYAKLFFAA